MPPTFSPPLFAVEINEHIRRAVRYAYERSDFYRCKMQQCGLSPADIGGLTDLALLPITEKAELAQAGRSTWCVPLVQVADIVTTSGTTGPPLLFPMTDADLHRLGEAERLSFSCAGLQPGDVAIIAVTLDRCFMAGIAYYQGLRHLKVTAIRAGLQSPELVCQMIERVGATAIISVPSGLDRIAAYARQRNIDLASSSLRRLICIGEPIRRSSMELTPLGQRLEQTFGARVYATYAATELVSSMCECGEGVGGHLLPDLHHVEILDENDQPVPPGQAGQVVVTTFGVQAMPVLRYRLGDVARLITEPCSCGRCTPRIGPVIGRLDQRLKIRGVTVYPNAVGDVLRQFEQVEDYLMIVTASSELSDELEVLVVTRDNGDGVLGVLAEALRGTLKVRPSLRRVSPDELRALRETRPSRKQVVFIDQRNPGGIAP